MKLDNVIDTINIVSAVLMVAGILLQTRGASLGAGSGASGELFTTRRGLEKSLYEATIVLAIIFVATVIASCVI